MPAQQPVRVALDLETTGLLAEQDSIIEVGAVKFAGDEILETFERFVAPRHTVPYRVQRLTGIRPADLVGAPTLAAVLPDLRAFLGECPLVGHSIPFDAAFLRRAGLARRNPLVDTYELASALLPNLPSYTLESVGTALAIASPVYHRALADAQLAREVLLALLARLDSLDTATLLTLDRLSTGRDWTPAYFIRAALRARPTHASGTLGDQLAAKMGMDPAVLGLAVAKPLSPSPAPLKGEGGARAAVAGSGSASPPLIGEGPGERSLLTTCFNEGGSALIEVAPDGRGYLGCLEALCAWVVESGARALVVVADGAAVARVARVRLPDALARLGLDASALPVAELLEPEAYLCTHRWFGAATLPRTREMPQELARGLAKLTTWASGTTTGSRAEVALTGQETVAWERARAGREFADSAARCAYRKRGYCFAARAEEAAAAARVIVTTQAALAADLVAQRDGGERRLPDVARVLVLEAHFLEDELRRAGSWALERHDLETLLANLGGTDPGGARCGLFHLAAQREQGVSKSGDASGAEVNWIAQVARAQVAAGAFFAALAHLHAAGVRGGPEARGDTPEQALSLDDGTRRSEQWGEVEQSWSALEGRLRALARLAVEVAARPGSTSGGQRGGVDGVEADLQGARRALDAVCAQAARALAAQRPGTIAWLRPPRTPPAQPAAATGAPSSPISSPASGAAGSRNGAAGKADKANQADQAGGAAEGTPALYLAPVEVGSLLAPLVAPERALVLAGSALAVGGEFDFTSAGLGLPATTRTRAATPDYTARTLLLLPEDAPEPNAPAFQRHLDELIVQVASALAGCTVVIFPSHAALRAAAMGIKRTLESQDVLVLAQGMDGSVRQLWQTFRTQPRVVLLGAGAFWDGAGREGASPVCVIVARLPFPSLSDPLLAARAETWPDQQAQFVVPHAALRLRQALNGLAWGQGDMPPRNAIILFDRRLSTRGYGGTVLATLPRCAQRTEELDQMAGSIAAWVDEAPAGPGTGA